MGIRLGSGSGGKRGDVFLTVFFSIYMFEYMVALTFIDQGKTDILDSVWQLVLHYLDLALAAGGFWAFALLRRAVRSETAWRRLLVILNLAYGLGMAALCLLPSAIAYSAAAMAVAFSLGVLGGMVYDRMSVALSQAFGVGKIMAIGASGAVVLQYLLQEHLELRFGLPVILVLGFSAALWLAVRRPWDRPEAACPPGGEAPLEAGRGLRRRLLILGLTVVALSVIGAFYDTQMMRLNVQSNYQAYNYYAWPRLFIIAGYVLIGFLGDLKKQAYVPLATLCIAMFAVFNPILFGEQADYRINMCLYYICLSANVSYFNLMFWSIAPQTSQPALWAGMGRVISGLAEVALTASHIGDLPLHWLIGIDIVMFVVLVIALAAGGYLLLGSHGAQPEHGADLAAAQALSPQERLQLYARRCSLTPRETEVLELLLTTDDDLQRIADSLYISRRMVQRYVTSIYEKTETKTRLGLFQSYLKFSVE